MHDWMDGDSEDSLWEGTGLMTERQLEEEDDRQSPYFGLSK